MNSALLSNEIMQTLDVLKNGGVVLYPTETLWGLGCDACNDKAIEKIYKIKNRDKSLKMISLLDDSKEIFKYVASPPINILEIVQSKTNPTTFIFESVLGISDLLLSENRKAAFRITNSPFCKILIKALGNPLVSTSANISKMPSPIYFHEIDEFLKSQVDYIVNSNIINEKMSFKASDIFEIDSFGNEKKIR